MSGTSTNVTPPRKRAFVALFFFCALALRGVFFLQARELEFFQVLGLDAAFYHEWASRIARGAPALSEPFFQGPLYPYFLGLLYKVFGTQVIVAQLAQLVLGAASTALVFVIGDRVFGRTAGILAGVLLGTYGYSMFLESHLVTAPLLLFLFLVFTWLLCIAVERDSLVWLLGAGVLLGILACGRGIFLLLVPWSLIAVLVTVRGQARSRALWHVGYVALGALVGLLPVTLHNVVRGGELALLTTNGGINYYIGNHDGATGAYTTIEGIDFFQPGSGQDGGSRALAERRSGESMSSGGASSYWLRQGLEWNLDHPGRTLALWAKKLLLVVSNYEIPQIENFDWAKDESSFLRASPVRWGWLFALAIVGMVTGLRRGRPAAILMLLTVGYVVSLLPFFVTGRFRVVIAPILAVFGAQGLVFLWQSLRARRTRPFLVATASFLALAVVFNLYAPAGIEASSDMLRDYSRGVTAMQAGNLEEALQHFGRAVLKDDTHPPTLANMAFCLAQTGQPERAVPFYRQAMALDPSQAPRLRQFLIQALLSSGNTAGAVVELEAAIQSDPNDLSAYATLGDVYLNSGETEKGRRMWSYVAENATDPQMKAAAQQRLAGP